MNSILKVKIDYLEFKFINKNTFVEKHLKIDFADKLNIFFSKNQFGKSVIFDAILFAFGIIDNKDQPDEIEILESYLGISYRNKENKITKILGNSKKLEYLNILN